MERVIQSLLALFSGSGAQESAPVRESTPRTETPELDPDAVSGLVTQLRSWLLGSQHNRSSNQGCVDQSTLTEFNQRITSRQLSRIPRQPRVLPRLIRALGDESYSHGDLADIIRDEPALTNDLLAVVNHSVEKRGQLPVDSVKQALFLVGFDGVKRAVSRAVTRPIVQGGSRAEAEFARQAWRWG